MCPAGCSLLVIENEEEICVSGNGCDKGREYGKKEYLNPERMVTSLIMNKNGRPVPVKTAAYVPKGRIYDVLTAMRDTVITRSVKIGDVVIADLCGLGVNVVATANVSAG